MQLPRSIRFFLTVLSSAIIMALIFWATGSAIDLWTKIQDLPELAQWVIISLLIVSIFSTGWVIWKIFRPTNNHAIQTMHEIKLDEASLKEAIQAATLKGIDTTEAETELAELNADSNIRLALSGRISVGKSSLLNALIPGQQAETDIRGGTTTKQHIFNSQINQTAFEIIDLPGTASGDQQQDDIAWQHASRSHVVLYISDGDLDRQQYQQLARLYQLNKPIILIINKADSYTEQECQQIIQHLETRLENKVDDIVALSTLTPEGLQPLYPALIAQLLNSHQLNERRHQAILQLAQQKLNLSEQQFRELKGNDLVRSHSQQAILGALAAVTPGSDLVIQGVLAAKLVKSLCALYEVSPKKLNINQFVKMAGGKVKRNSAMTMAVSGNALKSFPGIGTIAGGLLHAVAYGMIFQSLGHAVIQSLQEEGDFDPEKAQQKFSEQLNAFPIQEAKKMVKAALAETKRSPH